MAGVLGIEPRITESKSVVIPFYYTPPVQAVYSFAVVYSFSFKPINNEVNAII